MHEIRRAAGPPPPVPDAPIGALLERCEELTRAWLAALVSSWPLDRMDELPLAGFARVGSDLFRVALQATANEEAFDRIGAAAPGLGSPELAVHAVEVLRRVLWPALIGELRGAKAARVAKLADRLGAVCAAAAGAAVAERTPRRPTTPAIQAPPLAPRPRRLQDAGSALDGRPGLERAWLEAIDLRIEHHARDGRPFAVLLVEVDGRERLADADIDGDVAGALAGAERVLLGRLRPGDQLVREQAGRYWVLAPDTDAAAASRLAWDFAAASRELDDHRGAPLRFAVGTALCPQDGELAAALADHAESGLLAAMAAGVGVAPA